MQTPSDRFETLVTVYPSLLFNEPPQKKLSKRAIFFLSLSFSLSFLGSLKLDLRVAEKEVKEKEGRR